MTDYVVPPDAGPFTLVDNDTLTVTSVGSVMGTGVAAVTWDLNAGNTAPGIVIFNEGQISSTVRAIDTIDPSPGNSQVSLTNHGTITSANDAFRINNSLTDGVVLVDNHGSITTTGAGSGQAIDFAAVTAATSITITNRAGGLIQAADADAMRPAQMLSSTTTATSSELRSAIIATASTGRTMPELRSTTTRRARSRRRATPSPATRRSPSTTGAKSSATSAQASTSIH